MKKKRITYGVSGMMEYQAVIKVGRNNMKVNFSDGSMNAMGVNPAKFTTSDFMVQHAIENSLDFKKGRIFIFQVIELDGELRIERPAPTPPPATEPTPTPSKMQLMMQDTPASRAAEEKPAETPAPAETPLEQPTIAEETPAEIPADAEEETEAPAEESASGKVEVEFSVNDDAKDYLEQTFGAERNKLRTRADIIAAGETYGVDIKFV